MIYLTVFVDQCKSHKEEGKIISDLQKLKTFKGKNMGKSVSCATSTLKQRITGWCWGRWEGVQKITCILITEHRQLQLPANNFFYNLQMSKGNFTLWEIFIGNLHILIFSWNRIQALKTTEGFHYKMQPDFSKHKNCVMAHFLTKERTDIQISATRTLLSNVTILHRLQCSNPKAQFQLSSSLMGTDNKLCSIKETSIPKQRLLIFLNHCFWDHLESVPVCILWVGRKNIV